MKWINKWIQLYGSALRQISGHHKINKIMGSLVITAFNYHALINYNLSLINISLKQNQRVKQITNSNQRIKKEQELKLQTNTKQIFSTINNNPMKPFVLKGHERPINVVKFNYDGDLFFSGSAQAKINLWEAYTGERIGSYKTKSAVKSLDVDINTEYLVCCGFDGTLEIFNVKDGKSLRFVRFPLKLKHVEFNYGSTKLLVICDELKVGVASIVKVFDFKQLLNTPTNEGEMNPENLKPELEYRTTIKADDPKPNQVAGKALWYIDNESVFICTDDGYICRYDNEGKLIARALIHQRTKINGIAFSKDFSVLGTAADNGSKIIDPETLQILRYFKQELPMNTISISPLFCSPSNPKFHMVMGGGVKAILAAMTGGQAGFEAHVCNIMHGTEVGKISGHFGPINSVDFFKDGRGYVSGAEEGTIRVVRFEDAYFEENNPQFE